MMLVVVLGVSGFFDASGVAVDGSSGFAAVGSS